MTSHSYAMTSSIYQVMNLHEIMECLLLFPRMKKMVKIDQEMLEV